MLIQRFFNPLKQSTLGDPEHTAIIISDSPVPDRLGEDLDPENQPELKPWELGEITVIEQSVGSVSESYSFLSSLCHQDLA